LVLGYVWIESKVLALTHTHTQHTRANSNAAHYVQITWCNNLW